MATFQLRRQVERFAQEGTDLPELQASADVAHVPEKWTPVSRLREARFGGRRKVRKGHAQPHLSRQRSLARDLGERGDQPIAVERLDQKAVHAGG